MQLIIAEKPFLACRLQELNLLQPDTEVVFTFRLGLWRFSHPNITLADIPFTTLPNELRPQSHAPRYLMLDVNGKPAFCGDTSPSIQEHEARLNELVSYLRSNRYRYREVVCFVDSDRIGFGAAKQLLDQIDGDKLPVTYIHTHATDDQSLMIAWASRIKNTWSATSLAQQSARHHRVKQTFDYWWNANSSVVISELCKWVNLQGHPIMSKYELMLLCAIAETSLPIKTCTMLTLMQNWQGSGKYSTESSIGSALSRQAIVETAVNRGAIFEKGGSLNLTAQGKAFLSRLHKRTYDPDLPFRLEQWISTQDYSSIRRYINTIFGRQLRHQRNQLHCHSMTQELINQLYRQHNVSCTLLRKDNNEGNDHLELWESWGERIGEATVTALQSGHYRVSYSLEGQHPSEPFHVTDDEEIGGLSAMDCVRSVPLPLGSRPGPK